MPRPTTILWVAILASIVADLVIKPGDYIHWTQLRLFRPLLMLSGVIAASYQWRRQPRLLVRVRFAVLLLLAALTSGLIIHSAPQPFIDVWHVLGSGAEALVRGENPFRLEYRNIYGSAEGYSKDYIGSDGTSVRGYAYLPVPLFLSVPPVILLHDVRWLMLACVLGSAWAIRKMGHGSLEGELAAVFFLFQPRAFFLLEQSWTEPMVFGLFSLTLLAASRWCTHEAEPTQGGWVATGLAGGVFAGVKQYSPILLLPLFLALPRRGRVKAAALAVGVAVALILPFLLWDADAFFYSFTGNQKLPFRPDALSWLAGIAALGGPRLPFWPSFLFAMATLGATLQRRVSMPQATTVAGASLLVLLLSHKQAFCNYYWLVGSLLSVSVALHGARLRSEGATKKEWAPGG